MKREHELFIEEQIRKFLTRHGLYSSTVTISFVDPEHTNAVDNFTREPYKLTLPGIVLVHLPARKTKKFAEWSFNFDFALDKRAVRKFPDWEPLIIDWDA